MIICEIDVSQMDGVVDPEGKKSGREPKPASGLELSLGLGSLRKEGM